MVDPAEVPDGLDAAGLKAMTVHDGKWRVCEEFVCSSCGNYAHLHPYTNRIWGCKSCDFTTLSPSGFFKKTPSRQEVA